MIDEAIDGYRRALEFRPTDAVIYNNLANWRYAKGNEAEAIAAYERAIGLQPTYAEAYFNLGNLYKKAERDEQAIACYHRALQLNPQHAEASSNLGAVLKDQERMDEAEARSRSSFRIEAARRRTPLQPGMHAAGSRQALRSDGGLRPGTASAARP